MLNGIQASGDEERVALDLMRLILEAEAGSIPVDPSQVRGNYLGLYVQCLKAVSGEELDDIIKTE